MVSRERLLRLGATVAEHATTRRVRVLGQVLVLAGLLFVLLRVRSLWHGSHIKLSDVDWLALAGSLVLGGAGTAAGAFIWLAILDALGAQTRLRWTGVFFQAQLGKYVPGSVWQYAGRAALARANGIPVRPVGVSMLVEFVASGIAAGSMAALLLGWWGAAVVGAVAVFLLALERPTRRRNPVVFAAVRAALLYVPAWVLLSGSFWLCARGLVAIPIHDAAYYLGAFAVAWLAGLLAIYAPGGLGVREAVLVALLSGRIGAADALVIAAASRLILIVVDALLAAIAMAMGRSRSRLDVTDPV